MSDGTKNFNHGNMVGLACDEGLVLATSSRDHLLYQLDDRIFLCAPRSANNREKILQVSAQVEYLTRDLGRTITVGQVQDMLSYKYKDEDSVYTLTAGQDSSGLHIYSLKSNKGSRRVMYAARGTEEDDILSHLLEKWRQDLKLSEAEQLVRDLLKLNGNDYVDLCVLYKAEEKELLDVPQMQVIEGFDENGSD
ncbi:uncharacterized protein LOC119551066 [Drosophila subpulchrella]|uniref:uncharacterized protein LOC119551066 n=1 Tax=Drosophila subpulchrella TaxID=1486046 RepID=UPI0018A1873F|nr:uncharacterized protein LOC119551066 [Drosophila subpulchrella]XP_037716117.1 uncharacterized protein LOC119551066 [Drosophila subpulchrella]